MGGVLQVGIVSPTRFSSAVRIRVLIKSISHCKFSIMQIDCLQYLILTCGFLSPNFLLAKDGERRRRGEIGSFLTFLY